MKHYMVKCKYFFGNKISDYGLKNGYVDYGTLAKAFDAVLNNDIVKNTIDIGFWEQNKRLGGRRLPTGDIPILYYL